MDYSQGFPLYESANEYLSRMNVSFKYSKGFANNKELAEKLLSIANLNIVYETIHKFHLPSLIHYLTLCGENASIVSTAMDARIKSSIIVYGLSNKISNLAENVEAIAVSSWICFDDGIKDSVLLGKLIDNEFIEGDIDNNKNLFIQLTPTVDYIRINMIMGLIFKST